MPKQGPGALPGRTDGRRRIIMILLIDNYDSFVYNLKQYMEELGEEVTVRRNDQITIEEIETLNPASIVISPGPGRPEEAGLSVEIIRSFAGKIPILGVCLGHQAIARAFGGTIKKAIHLMHGKTSEIHHDGKTIFSGLDNPFQATRYHSLIVEEETLPSELEITARGPEGEIMALRHREFKIEGVQFHPESILTQYGKRLLHNFIAGKTEQIRIKEALDKVISGIDLSRAEAAGVMDTIMSGDATPAQVSALITGLRLKGETVEEISGCARIMREKARTIKAPEGKVVVDTCGTGGDGSNTFNISTVAALIAAGAGITVAKHGNRSVSSRCGSADVLKELEVNIMAKPEVMEKCLAEIGIAFLFAPLLHSAMKHAIGPRREIGIRTIFNILGPLSNPAGASIQLLGVYSEALPVTMARVLGDLGSERAWVVHGGDGLDEITLTTGTIVSELRNGIVKTFQLQPDRLGLNLCRPDELKGGDPEENARIILDILKGKEDPKRDIAILNAGAVIMLGGGADDLPEGIKKARESIDSGQALKKLADLREITGKSS
ncbi:MAG: bifunctional anthranilate synthase component II/anthranilate phosphoribosyltransferase [Candidatus Auribacterota bacterium]|nr:bifunctional anthranilate synthase component II/anthranilate phosphoribosyltransferase [Candidatus Auribacterota bacterium]